MLALSPTSGVTKPWLIATTLWVTGVIAFTCLNLLLGTTYTLCLFKNLTDLPCPGCGSTRAILALAQGQLSGALSFNPLTTLTLLCSPLILFAWTRNRKRKALDRWRPGRIFWTITVAVSLANWYFVIKNLP